MRAGEVACAAGKGLAAGLAATAAMTVSSTIEARLRGREPSTAPGDAATHVLGVKPQGPEAQARLSTLVHWGYGTGWGLFRGVLGAARLPAPIATAAHFGTVWGAGLALLPRLDVAPPVREWGAKSVAIDAFHHFVYAAAAGLAYRLLDRSGRH